MSLHQRVEQLLRDAGYRTDTGRLDRAAVQAAARQPDPDLLRLLLSDDQCRNRFFTEVDSTYVFDKVAFQKFVRSRQFLPDSYTAYRNRIGLSTGGSALSDSRQVVLDFPYKDTVLTGHQSKEQGAVTEQFINRLLAPEEIDLLFMPKALSNFQSFEGGEAISISDDSEQGFAVSDHYLIKGNNLIALASLREVFRNSIKLIYIDPPYNTGGDGFNYNDRFNHSTWLTFMKNRLEIARELLREDGVLFVSCDDRENAYLKVLMDEIFGRERFIANLVWRKKAGGGNDSQDIAVEHEYILAYRKQQNGIFKIPLDPRTLRSYKFEDEELDLRGPYKLKNLNDPSLGDSPGLHYDIECPDGTVLRGEDHQWKCNRATFEDRLARNRIVFKQVRGRWGAFYKIYLNEERGALRYDEQGNVIQRGRNLSSILYDVALNKDGSNDIKKHFGGRKPFSYPKPVELLKTLIRVATGPNDIVLDFFAGSGTTAEAVLALNAETGSSRRFLAIEQMDYIEDITLHRIRSAQRLYESPDTVHYLELHRVNQVLADRLRQPIEREELLSILEKLRHWEFVDHRHRAVLDHIEADDDPELIRRALLDLLDPNYLYLPRSEAEDAFFEYDPADLERTRQFYRLKQFTRQPSSNEV